MAKHLLWWRAPATVTKVLSATTYEVEHGGRTFQRAVSELRRYNPDEPPDELPMANHPDAFYTGYKVGNYVALADSDDPDDNHFHVARILAVADGRIRLQNYVTTSNDLRVATWQRLYQHSDGRYRRGGRKSANWQPVIDELEVSGEADFPYIRHHRLKFLASGRLTAKCKQQLQQSGLHHHVLGRSFP